MAYSKKPEEAGSRKRRNPQQVQGKEICLKAGCDICLAFPFNVDTFLSSIDRLIGKKGLITEYYSSPDSSFVLEEGKTMHKEDQVFIIKIEKIYPSPNIMFDMYISNY